MGVEVVADALVDSGYSASLAISDSALATLNLDFRYQSEAMLADGSLHGVDVYDAEIHWDGRWRKLLVSNPGGETLVGMQLLEGLELTISVSVGGKIEITPIVDP